MLKAVQRFTRLCIIFIIAILLVNFIYPNNLSAKSKKSKHVKVHKKKSKKSSRHYNPEATRTQAMDIMSGSEEISQLAGIETDGKIQTVQNKENFVEQGEDLKELEAEDDVVVDMDSFKMLWSSAVDDIQDDNESTNWGIAKKDIMGVIMDWLGTPYHFGGLTDRGIDCSAFVQRVYMVAGQVHLPRTAQEQFGVGKQIRRTELQFGDMIFFHTRRHAYASHVGIYLGDNLFAHASSRYGVTVSSLESTYYDARFIGARRLSPQDVSKLSVSTFKIN